MNRVLTLRSLKFSEQREEENQSKVTPNFALLNEKTNTEQKQDALKKNKSIKNEKDKEVAEKVPPKNDTLTTLYGSQKSSLIAVTHETISTTPNTNTLQATSKSPKPKKSTKAVHSGGNEDETREKGSFSTASATSNAMNRFSAPILVDDSLVERRATRADVEAKGIFCPLGHAYVCHGDVELGVPSKDFMKSFILGEDKILIEKNVTEHSEDSTDEKNSKVAEEKVNEDIQSTDTVTIIVKTKTANKVLNTTNKPPQTTSTSQNDLMKDIRANSAQIRLETVTRWRNEFDATKQKKDRELIKKLVSRDEARKFVLSSQETMEKSIQKLINRDESGRRKTANVS